MTKEQFIMELEQCLQGEVSAYELSDSLTYYRQYFEDEIRNGKRDVYKRQILVIYYYGTYFFIKRQIRKNGIKTDFFSGKRGKDIEVFQTAKVKTPCKMCIRDRKHQITVCQ